MGLMHVRIGCTHTALLRVLQTRLALPSSTLTFAGQWHLSGQGKDVAALIRISEVGIGIFNCTAILAWARPMGGADFGVHRPNSTTAVPSHRLADHYSVPPPPYELKVQGTLPPKDSNRLEGARRTTVPKRCRQHMSGVEHRLRTTDCLGMLARPQPCQGLSTSTPFPHTLKLQGRGVCATGPRPERVAICNFLPRDGLDFEERLQPRPRLFDVCRLGRYLL